MIIDMYRQALAAAKKGKRSITVMTWCRSGRHRSVAAALCARHVLKMLNLEVLCCVRHHLALHPLSLP